jgi:ribosomal protein L37E
MFHNAGLFLKKAAEEIAAHGDGSDAAFDVDRATLVTVLMQIAVELSATATVLKNEGFAGVMRPSDLPATDADAKALWEAGRIRTVNFEQIKPNAAKYLGDEAFWLNVDFLQRTRNKLVHFHAPIFEGDRFDLKYDAVQVLLQIIAALRKTEEHEFAFGAMNLLGLELFSRLVRTEHYREQAAARAQNIDFSPHRCGACGATAYLRDEDTCIACGYSSEEIFLRCPDCRASAVFYDHLNLDANPWLSARCGQCDWEGCAARCATCEIDYTLESHAFPICPYCQDD